MWGQLCNPILTKRGLFLLVASLPFLEFPLQVFPPRLWWGAPRLSMFSERSETEGTFRLRGRKCH